MNNERKLFNYIMDNGGQVVANYVELAKELGVSKDSARRYAKILSDDGYILKQCKWTDMRKQMVLSIIQDIEEEDY